MQLMSDAVTVLGSRHGMYWLPCQRRAHLVRAGIFPDLPLDLRAGLIVNGRTLVLPLTPTGTPFAFCEQDITPCSMKLTGVDPETALKVELTVTIPFRPRDAAFSTTPVLDVRLALKPLGGQFRWTSAQPVTGPVRLFLEVNSPAFTAAVAQGDTLALAFDAPIYDCMVAGQRPPVRFVPQQDALVVHAGELQGRMIATTVAPAAIAGGAALHLSWCTWSAPILRRHGQPAPFKYTEQFASLAEVVAWVRAQPDAIRDNAARVDGLLARHNLSRSTANLTALTLHSWLINTWWCRGPERDSFTVWEGSCYFHSTVDVEYTQAPFYLAIWPELLGLELDQWPDFTIPGDTLIGEAGRDTVVFMHDMGQQAEIDTTRYNHPMPVEENTNYVLLSYGYWRRTGDDSRLRRHAETLRRALDFVVACDSTGTGILDRGTANTIDDGSPAVQFGKGQVYLTVKAMAALDVGAEMLAHANQRARVPAFRAAARRFAQVLRRKGWQRDHFVTLLEPSAAGVKNSWTKEVYQDGNLPGWDAAHIYTANGLCLLDQLGRRSGIDERRLATDLRVATARCLDKYGCRHSDYAQSRMETLGEGGLTQISGRIGWIAMNLMRDLSALYRGVDLRALMDRYWEFQVVVNTQGPYLFFETFNGNNLMNYPRGLVVWGYHEAVGGVRLDRVAGTLSVRPLDDQVEVPLLHLADWTRGVAPMVRGGRLRDPHRLARQAGLVLQGR